MKNDAELEHHFSALIRQNHYLQSSVFNVCHDIKLTTGRQSNLTKGHIAAARGRFSRICQVAPMRTPIQYTPIGIRTIPVLPPAESLWVYRPPVMSGSVQSWAGHFSPSKLLIHAWGSRPNLTHASFSPPEFTSETASRSLQPFFAQPTTESSYTLQWAAPFPSKLPSPWTIWTPSKIWFIEPTRVHSPNGVLIGSAVFGRLTIVTDRQTIRYSVCNNRPHL